MWCQRLSLRPCIRRHVRCASTSLPLTTKFNAERHELSASGQPYRVVFGSKSVDTEIGNIAHSRGVHKMLVIRDRDPGAASRTQYIEFLLMKAGIPCFSYTLKRDCATIKDIDDGVSMAQRVGANGILAFGGGSTMDAARAIAFILGNDSGSAETYINHPPSELQPAIPHFIVPTTAGSGAEISTQALILDEEAEIKQSFVSVPIEADALVIDPILAVTVPLLPTIQGALTSLGQCIESYLLGCDEDTERITLQGIDIVASALAQPLTEGRVNLKRVELREQLALASLASGIAAQSSGCGTTHSIAESLGSLSDLPYTHVTSAFLPFVMDRYSNLALENQGDLFFDEIYEKLERVADRLTIHSGFQASSPASWLRYVSTRFDLPKASSMELDDQLVNILVERTAQHQKLDEHEDAILDKEDIRGIVESAKAS